MKIEYSEEESEFIKNNLHLKNKQIASILNREVYIIEYFLRKNKIRRHNQWTEKDDCFELNFIHEKYGKLKSYVSKDIIDLVKSVRWYFANKEGKFYLAGSIIVDDKRVSVFLHRLITGYTMVDHIDGNGLNNKWENLRECSAKQNCWNSNILKGKSIYKGVSPSNSLSKPWRALIMKESKRYYLGCFESEIDAAKAYDVKAIELFGVFARLNFPLDKEN